jgi:hypothetical protein
MAKTAQILSNLNENLFDFAVKKFCGSSLEFQPGIKPDFRIRNAKCNETIPAAR